MDIKFNKKLFSDADICMDMLYSQELVANYYVDFSTSCATKGVHEEIISLISEEAKIHGEIYTEMLKRGFLQPQNAKEELVDEIKATILSKKPKQ